MEKTKWYLTGKARFGFLGFVFGLFFPVLAITVDLIRLDLSFSLANIHYLHSIIPIHHIIETAPVILAFMAFNCGRAFDRIKEKNNEITEAASYKDNFLASMSHEIRTPMAGIMGVIDLLEKSENIKVKEQEYLNIIRSSSNDLMKIINDILDLSKLKQSKLELHCEETEIRALCEEVKNLFKAYSKSRNVRLKSVISGRVPTFLKLDQVRVKQILSNLVSNAIKFSKEGGEVTLKLSYVTEEKGKPSLKFDIIDRGIGIKEDQLASVFMPYEQVGDYSNKHIDGTGLGLFICQSLVELMNGKIGVESEFNVGSTFWFTVKASEVRRNDRVPIEEQVKITQVKELNTNIDLNILIAEDNKILCKVFEKMLKQFGCQLVITNDGKEITEVFQEGVYDLILMDINMPKMTGTEALNYLKKNFKNLPPVISASASALKGDIDKYLELGFDDYITKPFAMEQLQEKLEYWKPICEKNRAERGNVESYLDDEKQTTISK